MSKRGEDTIDKIWDAFSYDEEESSDITPSKDLLEIISEEEDDTTPDGEALVEVSTEETKGFRPIIIRLSNNRMTATLSLHQASMDDWGQPGTSVTSTEQIMDELTKCGIVFGLYAEAVDKAFEAYQAGEDVENVVIAEGIYPRKGTDASIEYKVNLKTKVGSIDEETGKIDFRDRDFLTKVNEGEEIAVKTLCTPGTPGKGVTGDEIRPGEGNDISLHCRKNVEVVTTEEGVERYVARRDGVLIISEDTIDVTEMTMIEGDVDYSTGNIEAEGSIIIKGKVSPGFKVKAGGNLYIQDFVESAFIEAGGDIQLTGGIKGQNKGIIKAGGRVKSTYIERAVVEADGDVIVGNAVVDSRVTCGGKLIAFSGRGSIIGGKIRAAGGIEAKRIGAGSSSLTDIAVGFDFNREKKQRTESADLKTCEANIKKVEETIKRTPTDNKKVHAKLQGLLQQLMFARGKLLKEKTDSTKVSSHVPKAYITVRGKIYPGVVISMGSLKTITQEELNGVRISPNPDSTKIVSKKI